jgi:deoxyribose-phosphate aldolase
VRGAVEAWDESWIGSEPDLTRVPEEVRAAEAGGRTAVQGPRRAGDLRKAMSLLDLTSLSGRETPADIRSLCSRAVRPLPGEAGVHVAAVCVFPEHVPLARETLGAAPVAVATVAGDFPRGTASLSRKVEEVRAAVRVEAGEVDVVVDRRRIEAGDWHALYREVRALRKAAPEAVLKVILGTGELASLSLVERASRVCLLAGADFLKTSTGFEGTNATLPAGAAMCRALLAFRDRSGTRAGLKPAGGIRRPEEALAWIEMGRTLLGPDWIQPARFRIGASGLLETLVGTMGLEGPSHLPFRET